MPDMIFRIKSMRTPGTLAYECCTNNNIIKKRVLKG